jgi:hypothetical protein
MGAERAPWHKDEDSPPGHQVWVWFEQQGDSAAVFSRVRPGCAIKSTKQSRSRNSTEEMLAIFSAVQIFTALQGELETALNPYGR